MWKAYKLQTRSIHADGKVDKNGGPLISTGRFQRPSERVPFSDEGGFVFSKAPFKGTLHEGLKGASTPLKPPLKVLGSHP